MSEVLVNRFKDTESSFLDYKRFQEPTDARDRAKEAFVTGETWAPEFSYPKIIKLYDTFDAEDKESKKDTDRSISRKKKKIQLAVFALDRVSANNPEAALYADFHDVRLKRIMLNEASKRMITAGSEEARWVAAEEFKQLGRELYGDMDEGLFHGLLGAEQSRLISFEPQNQRATDIKNDLESFYASSETELGDTFEIISPDTLVKLNEVILARYSDALAVFPNTDDLVLYDATESAALLNRALEVSGFAEDGWKCVVDKKKQTPATAANFQKISLPPNLKRNASQLQRLMLHEQEVHARRGFNGKKTGLKILQNGTAEYADVEEGLGVLFEAAHSGTFEGPATSRAEERYITAGLALGLFGPERDARQTHEILWRILAVKSSKDGAIDEDAELAAKKASMVHIENAFRGTPTTMRGVIYPKLKVYYEGLVKNCRLFENYEGDFNDLIDELMIGKYDHTNPTEKALVLDLINRKQSATI